MSARTELIDLETWLILAERCHTIRQPREEQEQAERAELVFDEHDQARVVERAQPP